MLKDEAMYFYKTNFDYAKPKNLLKKKETFFKQVTIEDNSNELNEGFEVLFDFVELIYILKAMQEERKHGRLIFSVFCICCSNKNSAKNLSNAPRDILRSVASSRGSAATLPSI